MSHPVCAARSEQYHVGSLLQVPGARSLRNGRAWQAGARGARARVSSPAGKLGWPQMARAVEEVRVLGRLGYNKI